MIYEEAIEYITERYVTMSMCLTLDECRKHNKAISMAIEALKKQIPKKPIIRKAEDYFGNVKHTLCPNCRETEFVFTQPCFCHHCGQAIDWEENE